MNRPAAAMDIGSNTVHLLVGSVRDGRVEPVDDASELVGWPKTFMAAARSRRPAWRTRSRRSRGW